MSVCPIDTNVMETNTQLYREVLHNTLAEHVSHVIVVNVILQYTPQCEASFVYDMLPESQDWIVNRALLEDMVACFAWSKDQAMHMVFEVLPSPPEVAKLIEQCEQNALVWSQEHVETHFAAARCARCFLRVNLKDSLEAEDRNADLALKVAHGCIRAYCSACDFFFLVGRDDPHVSFRTCATGNVTLVKKNFL